MLGMMMHTYLPKSVPVLISKYQTIVFESPLIDLV